jgi:hypothetical protein
VDRRLRGADEDEVQVLDAAAPAQVLQGVQARRGQQRHPAEVDQDPEEPGIAQLVVDDRASWVPATASNSPRTRSSRVRGAGSSASTVGRWVKWSDVIVGHLLERRLGKARRWAAAPTPSCRRRAA